MRLHQSFDAQAQKRPDAEFAFHNGRRTSYREALIESHRLAHALVNAGLQEGDRVAFLSKNNIEQVLIYFGCSRVGARFANPIGRTNNAASAALEPKLTW